MAASQRRQDGGIPTPPHIPQYLAEGLGQPLDDLGVLLLPQHGQRHRACREGTRRVTGTSPGGVTGGRGAGRPHLGSRRSGR